MFKIKLSILSLSILFITQTSQAQEKKSMFYKVEKSSEKGQTYYIIHGEELYSIPDYKKVDGSKIKNVGIGDDTFTLSLYKDQIRVVSEDNDTLATLYKYKTREQRVVLQDGSEYLWKKGNDKWDWSYYQDEELLVKFKYENENGTRMFIYEKYKENIPGEEILILLANNYGVDILLYKSVQPYLIGGAILMGILRAAVSTGE